jgi:hypothetical protein
MLVASAAVPLWYAFEHGYRSTTSYTCIQCRAIQRVTTFFGCESVKVEETDDSRWLAKQQPTHSHQWGWCGTIITHYPISYGRGCGRRHPIWRVRPEWQRKFVERASPAEIESFYTALDSEDRKVWDEAIDMVLEKFVDSSK